MGGTRDLYPEIIVSVKEIADEVAEGTNAEDAYEELGQDVSQSPEFVIEKESLLKIKEQREQTIRKLLFQLPAREVLLLDWCSNGVSMRECGRRLEMDEGEVRGIREAAQIRFQQMLAQAGIRP